MGFKYTGKYTQAFLSDKKIKAESIESDFYKKLIEVKPNEAKYIYSFKGNRLVYAKGYEKITKKKDEELDIIALNNLFTPYFKDFVNEYHDRLLLFLYNNDSDNIESFSSHVIIKVKEFEHPLMLNIKVFKTDDNGNLISIIGTNTVDINLRTTDIIQYDFSGDFNTDFIDEINNNLDFEKCISGFNIKIIEELESGKSLPSISNELSISQENLELNIEKLLKRFELNDENELIEFAKSNHLIPNQFERYLNK